MNNKELIKEIVEGILDFKIIPFFGAGMSKSFGFKDWDELISVMRNELTTHETDNLKVAQLYENTFGRTVLVNKLKEFYQIENIENLNTDNQQLILAMNPPIIYTTNYDEGIEQTAEMISRAYYKISCLKDIVEMPHTANIIVKFHGDFTAEDEIVLTENDYQKRMAIENPLDVIFRSHLLGKRIFFIGYGLRDKNIDFIFKRHSDLYGKQNLPPSYIVIFKDSYSEERLKEFHEKNINTIVLDSPEELHQLLKEVNEEVYNGDLKRQADNIFKSFPQQVLLKKEFENLEKFWQSESYSEEDKVNKAEETLSLKMIPHTLQPQVASFFLKLFENSNLSNESVQKLLRVFDWVQIDPKLNFETGAAIVGLTERPFFHRTLTNFQLLDPLQSVQKHFKDVGTVLCIFLYLIKVYQEKKKLAQEQLHDLDYTLRACNYATHDFGEALTKEMREEILNHFFSHYPGWKPRSGFMKPRSLSEIQESMLKMMPEKFKDRF